MGKLFKGAVLGAISALGAYYYKNPEEYKKHKEIAKENIKLAKNKTVEYLETNGISVNCERCGDKAKTKFEEVSEKEESDFVELKHADTSVEQSVIKDNENIAEKVSDIDNVVELAEDAVKEPASDVVKEVKETAGAVEESAIEKKETFIEKIANIKDTASEKLNDTVATLKDGDKRTELKNNLEEKFQTAKESTKEKINDVVDTIKNEEKRTELKNNLEEKFQTAKESTKEKINEAVEVVKGESTDKNKDSSKTTLDSIVALFSSKEKEDK